MNELATPAFVLTATYRIHPDDVDTYRELAGRMAEAAVGRDGCSFLHAAQDVRDPATFHLSEGWESREAFDAHVSSNVFKEILDEAMRLRIVERLGDIYYVSGRETLEMPS